MYKNIILSKLIKEPLLHFLLTGFGLFFLFSQVNNDEDSNKKKQIIVNKSKLTTLYDTFIEENARVPTSKELREILEADIREEILYHEALAQGLDKNDRVIRHRLAQKMEYLFEDISIFEEPSDEVLKAFLKEEQKNFTKEFSEIKQKLKNKWIEKKQKEANDAFFENLKSNYHIVMSNEVRKELNK